MEKLTYNDILDEISEMNIDERKAFFESFFVRDNLSNYYLDDVLSENERGAVELLFEGQGSLSERVMEALNKDGNCREAFLVSDSILDDVITYDNFRKLSKRVGEFESLSPYSKASFLTALEMYSDFLTSIQNITGAIRQLKTMLSLCDNPGYHRYVKLAFLYGLLEDHESLYELCESIDCEDCFIYLVTIVTLLKHGDDRAEDIFHDMLRQFPESSYIDHMWDLDMSKAENARLADNVDDCYDMICSLPDFFSWCNEHKSLERLS